MNRRKLDDRAVEIAWRDLLAGESIVSVTGRLGVHHCTLRRALREHGHDWGAERKRRDLNLRVYSAARGRRAEQLLRSGCCISEVASSICVSENTLRDWIARGLVDASLRRSELFSAAADRRLHALYMASPDMTVKDLCRMRHIGYSALLRRWRRLGLNVDRRCKGSRLVWQRRHAAGEFAVDYERALRLWRLYCRGNISMSAAANAMGMCRKRLRAVWQGMGFDQQAVARRRFDARNGAGAYDRFCAASAARNNDRRRYNEQADNHR
ncbi:MAG: hypothetical protein ACI4P5_00590 [Candidatus Fimadaptatus sp.]